MLCLKIHNFSQKNNPRKTAVFYKFCFLIIVSVLFLTCKSIPSVPDALPEEAEYIQLGSGASSYLFIDAEGAKLFMDIINIADMQIKQAQQIIDSTNSAVLAFFPEGDDRRFQLVSWGKYPSAGASIALYISRQWKHLHSQNKRYWYSAANRLSVALSSNQVFVTSWVNDKALSPVTELPGVRVPDGFNKFRKGAVLSCWMENPGRLINNFTESFGIQIPAERIFVSLFQNENLTGKYDASMMIQFSSPSHARGVASIISLAGIFMPDLSDSAELRNEERLLTMMLFAHPPVLEGNVITLKSSPLLTEDITLLVSMFSIY